MATNTNNLNLKKPDKNDFYNIDDFNENFQKIDDAFKNTVCKKTLMIEGEQPWLKLKRSDEKIAFLGYSSDRLDFYATSENGKDFGLSIASISTLPAVQLTLDDKFYTLYGSHNAPTPPIESKDYPGCYYRKVGNETEWINPPLIANKTFRTTERFNGRVVYTTSMNFMSDGLEPGVGRGTQDRPQPYEVPQILSVSGVVKVVDDNNDKNWIYNSIDSSIKVEVGYIADGTYNAYIKNITDSTIYGHAMIKFYY